MWTSMSRYDIGQNVGFQVSVVIRLLWIRLVDFVLLVWIIICIFYRNKNGELDAWKSYFFLGYHLFVLYHT